MTRVSEHFRKKGFSCICWSCRYTHHFRPHHSHCIPFDNNLCRYIIIFYPAFASHQAPLPPHSRCRDATKLKANRWRCSVIKCGLTKVNSSNLTHFALLSFTVDATKQTAILCIAFFHCLHRNAQPYIQTFCVCVFFFYCCWWFART